MKAVVGIDIGGTNTKVGIIDERGNCLAETNFKTQDDFENFEDYTATLSKEILQLIQHSGIVDILGIGIGAPNGNYYKGTIENAPNLKWKGVLHLKKLVEQHSGISNIVLTNDANAAAIGEMVFGAAREMNDFIVMTLGTGLGSGIVTGGKLLLGHDGFAGEIGHVTAIENGRKCGCGKKGCLETYVSATGITRTVAELIATGTERSEFRNIPFNQFTSKTIADLAINNDPIATKAFEYTGKIFGQAMANTVAHLSPEAIILFGGLANSGDLLLKPFKKSLENNLMDIYKNKVNIILSGLNNGANAAVLGAASLILRDIG